MAEKRIEFPAIKVQQPIGEFYIASIKSEDLISISYADIRTLERELDDYVGIQRRLSTSRVKKLEQYVNTYDATFPTSIILAIDEKFIEWSEEKRTLSLYAQEEDFAKIAKILDGQHRIEGLKGLDRVPAFDLNVSIFVGIDIATQANIFATVNLAQTKVNRSLAYDLFEYEKKRSPQKSAHDITVALDRIEDSPFYHRIKRLGTGNPERKGETLTQAAVVESLMDYMTSDATEDRNKFFALLIPQNPSDDELKKRIFRNLFLNEKEIEITQILLAYFNAVKERWPNSWNDINRPGNVLPKTNGFKALMRFLRDAYLKIVGKEIGKVVSKEEFAAIFEKITLRDEDFNTTTFKPGGSGELTLYKILKEQAGF